MIGVLAICLANRESHRRGIPPYAFHSQILVSDGLFLNCGVYRFLYYQYELRLFTKTVMVPWSALDINTLLEYSLTSIATGLSLASLGLVLGTLRDRYMAIAEPMEHRVSNIKKKDETDCLCFVRSLVSA